MLVQEQLSKRSTRCVLIIDAGCCRGYSLGSRPEAEFFTPKKAPRVGPSKDQDAGGRG